MEQKAKVVKVTAAQEKQLGTFSTVSDRIRYLNKEGYTRSQIARYLNKRYQHVRNVLVQDALKKQS